MTVVALPPEVIATAHARIAPFIHQTPLLESSLLNTWLGHRIVFKAEGFQKMGAFKFRGAMNTLLSLKQANQLPPEVVAFSSGNHAQAVALASRELGIKARIVIPAFASAIKIQATYGYGADVILTPTRQEAEATARAIAQKGAYLIPPYDHDSIIAGQGTACYEALRQDKAIDAVFATCGGGGLLSGTFLAAQLINPSISVYGAEPLNANDAAQSMRNGSIFRFAETPSTIADGATTLGVCPRTFHYLQKLAGMVEVSEEAIIYWTQWLMHLLKIVVEPTSAAAMAGAVQWLAGQDTPRTLLIILSGGNMAPDSYLKIWQRNHLQTRPSIGMNL